MNDTIPFPTADPLDLKDASGPMEQRERTGGGSMLKREHLLSQPLYSSPSMRRFHEES
jgi:hypothetical protein